MQLVKETPKTNTRAQKIIILNYIFKEIVIHIGSESHKRELVF